jgi:hypothetical protein
VAGSPMPLEAAPLGADELEAVRLWILNGAVKWGVVGDSARRIDVASLLESCTPAKSVERPAAQAAIDLGAEVDPP